MSALSHYVDQLKCQANLLEAAADFDDACLSPSPPDFGRLSPRRHWTRQDGNRLKYESACDERALGGSLNPPAPAQRMDTRVERMLRRFLPRIMRVHEAALAEAVRLGIYVTLAPLVVEATKAHRLLLRNYELESADLPKAKARHEAEIAQLELHCVPAEYINGLHVAALFSPEATTVSVNSSQPPPRWATSLTRLESRLLNVLWGGRPKTITDLHNTAWEGRDVQDGAIEKAIRRANSTILDDGYTITLRSGRVQLEKL